MIKKKTISHINVIFFVLMKKQLEYNENSDFGGHLYPVLS